MHALVVEDESKLAELIANRLAGSRFETQIAGTLARARESISDHPFQIVLLDRRLPDGDGLSFLPQVRERQPEARVIVLSALDAVSDRVLGLETGADDYLSKPFDADELIARVRAQLRRSGSCAGTRIICGAVTLDPSTLTVSVGERPLILHRREFALLEPLMRNFERVTPRAALIKEVYAGHDEARYANALESLVFRVRRRLAESGAGLTVHTVRGIGYFLASIES